MKENCVEPPHQRTNIDSDQQSSPETESRHSSVRRCITSSKKIGKRSKSLEINQNSSKKSYSTGTRTKNNQQQKQSRVCSRRRLPFADNDCLNEKQQTKITSDGTPSKQENHIVINNLKAKCDSKNQSSSTPFSLRKQIAIALQLSRDPTIKSTDITKTSEKQKSTQYSSEQNPEIDTTGGNSTQHCSNIDTGIKKLNRNNKGETELHLAAIRGDFFRLEQLLKNLGKNITAQSHINVKDFAGWTPLHEACNRGHTQAVRVLINHGADVNARADCGTTPLIDAAANGHLSIVKLLTKYGADPSISNNRGQTALEVAGSDKIQEILKELTFQTEKFDANSVNCDSQVTKTNSKSDESYMKELEVHDKINISKFSSDNINLGKFNSNLDQSGKKIETEISSSSELKSVISDNESGINKVNKKMSNSSTTTTTASTCSISTSNVISFNNDPQANGSILSSNSSSVGSTSELNAGSSNNLTATVICEPGKEKPKSDNDNFHQSPMRDDHNYTNSTTEQLNSISKSMQQNEVSANASEALNIKGDSSAASSTNASSTSHSAKSEANHHQLRGRKRRRSGGSSGCAVNDNSIVNTTGCKKTKDTDLKIGLKLKKTSSDVEDSGEVLAIGSSTKDESDMKSADSSSTVSLPSNGNGIGAVSNVQVASSDSSTTLKVPPIRIVLPSATGNTSGSGTNSSGTIVVINSQSGNLVDSSSYNHHHVGVTNAGNKYPYVVNTEHDSESVSENSTMSSTTVSGTSTNTVTTTTSTTTTHRITRSSQRVALQQQKHHSSDNEEQIISTTSTRKKKNRSGGAGSANHNYNSTNSPSTANSNNQTNDNDDNSSSSSASGPNSTSNTSTNVNSNLTGNGNKQDNMANAAIVSNLYQYAPSKNSYRMFLSIRDHIKKRRQSLPQIIPKPPQGFNEYLMNRCTYLLHGSPSTILPNSPPSSLTKGTALFNLFMEQEQERHRMRLQHQVEQEKLVMAVEQEVIRVHSKAAHAHNNQMIPLSICTYLKDEELYNKLELETDHTNDNVIIAQIKAENPRFLNDGPSALTGCGRIRYNGRLFISWLRDVNDKWSKIKKEMLNRQRSEAESLAAIQRLRWEWKVSELADVSLAVSGNNTTCQAAAIDETFVPTVKVLDDFNILPA